ncbi:MAG: S1 RNA-binding domain-containing protein [Lachnospiraceae bacterium]|nr:S1 RNA-binding domain-containing protein [Lachnospiraceae bacterium]
MEIGKYNTLVMVQKEEFGVYLSETMSGDKEKVLLPKKWVPGDMEIGDPVSVFVYKDSQDRPVATTMKPALTLSEMAKLKVTDVTKIGAFLDWGLEKDLFLPFREQTFRVKKNDEVPVALYLDKSERLCATMKLYPYLSLRTPYSVGDEVEGYLYEVSPNFGAFVAVDDKYSALIPKREVPSEGLQPGMRIKARVSRIHEDGKMDLDLRKKAYLQMEEDSDRLLSLIRENGGKLSVHDKSSPEQIRSVTGMSKNEFKRAVGRLYKQRRIRLLEDGIAEETV